jgi:hypothetical protein
VPYGRCTDYRIADVAALGRYRRRYRRHSPRCPADSAYSLGPLDFLLPKNDPIELAAALEKTWERRDEARMRRAAMPADANIEAVRPPRQTQSFWWSRLIRSGPVVRSKFIATDSTAKDTRSKRSA